MTVIRISRGDPPADERAAAVPALRSGGEAPHSHPRRLSYLDGWRGLSIIVVLAGHFIGNIVVGLGHLGVEMFFVLSGRLMAQILFVERFPLGEFYRRRFARIFPAMLAFLVISYLAFRGDPYLGARAKLAIASQAFIYNYVGVAGHRSPLFDHTWSLCIEEHSYVVLAILAWAVRRSWIMLRPTLLIGAILSMLDGIVSEVVLRQDWYGTYWRTDAHIASILISAWLFLTLRDFGDRVPAWLSPACTLLGVAVFANGVPDYLCLTAGTTLLAAAIASVDRAWTRFRAVLSLRLLTVAGALSYSVYLWQQPFYQIAIWKWRLPPSHAVLFVMPAIACGVLSYFLVEKPSRRWLNSLEPGSRRQPVLQPATPSTGR